MSCPTLGHFSQYALRSAKTFVSMNFHLSVAKGNETWDVDGESATALCFLSQNTLFFFQDYPNPSMTLAIIILTPFTLCN